MMLMGLALFCAGCQGLPVKCYVTKAKQLVCQDRTAQPPPDTLAEVDLQRP